LNTFFHLNTLRFDTSLIESYAKADYHRVSRWYKKVTTTKVVRSFLIIGVPACSFGTSRTDSSSILIDNAFISQLIVHLPNLTHDPAMRH
jgi:hypothetical protein